MTKTKTAAKANRRLWVCILSLILSVVMGVLSHDLWIGGTILFTSLTSAYFASVGRKSSYILSTLNYLLMGLVSLDNSLFGSAIFYIFVCTPLQIWGYISWGRHAKKSGDVKTRKFTLGTSLAVVSFCIIGSLLFGWLLSFIPSQQLSFLDAASNCINLCGIILMALRYAESWWVWLANNTLDLTIWTIILIGQTGTANTPMMFVSSVAYLIINVYGAVKWWRTSRVTRRKA